jgi:outer membrane protein TolC
VSQPPPKARISAMAVVKRLAWTCSAATRLLNSSANEYRAGTQNYTTVVTAQALELSNRVAALQVQASRPLRPGSAQWPW